MRAHRSISLITALVLGFASILMSVTAVAEDRILVTTEFPDEDDADVLEQSGAPGPGSFISGGPTLNEPQRILYGPEGDLYILDASKPCCPSDAEDDYAVYRYDGDSGDYIDTFIAPGAGNLNEGQNMIFGPDGNLYITVNEITGNDFCDGGAVHRYDGTTGAFMDVFVANGAGNQGDDDERLCEAQAIAFTPAGDLLVGNTSSGADNVLRFDGTTGAYIDAFVPSDSNGLDDPQYMVIGPDNNLYLGSESPDQILRYNGTTGAFIDVFVPDGSGGIDEPKGMGFGFDGNLYVVDGDSPGSIKVYRGSNGDYLRDFVIAEESNMQDSRSLLFFMRMAEIPAIDPFGIAILVLALGGIAGFVLVRRKRGASA